VSFRSRTVHSTVKQGPTDNRSTPVSQGGVPAFIAIIEEDGERVLITSGPTYGLNLCDVSRVIRLDGTASASEEVTAVT
jgi:hypothetical protein